jgi:hypothetical protein
MRPTRHDADLTLSAAANAKDRAGTDRTRASTSSELSASVVMSAGQIVTLPAKAR